MSNVIELASRSAAKQPTPIDEHDFTPELHARAFVDLEGAVCDLERAASIAADYAAKCPGRDTDFELMMFAVSLLNKMARQFRDDYFHVPFERRAEAFVDLEGGIADLACAGRIAFNCVSECTDASRALEMAVFAVRSVADSLQTFQQDYHRRWHGELEGAS